MSDSWNIHCLDCNDDAGMSIDFAKNARLLIEHRKKIEPLGGLLSDELGVWSLDLTVNGEEVDAGFFWNHKGHRLAPRNCEGELDTSCGESFDCPTCGTVKCDRLEHSIAHCTLHYHTAEKHVVHWEKERG